MQRKEKYQNGLLMMQFQRLDLISVYNSNYYVGFDNDLLYAKSDDDNTTEWWLVANLEFIYLGESYTSKNEVLNCYENRCT